MGTEVGSGKEINDLEEPMITLKLALLIILKFIALVFIILLFFSFSTIFCFVTPFCYAIPSLVTPFIIFIFFSPKFKKVMKTYLFKIIIEFIAGVVAVITMFLNPGLVWQHGWVGMVFFIVSLEVFLLCLGFLMMDTIAEKLEKPVFNKRPQPLLVLACVIVSVCVILALFCGPYFIRNEEGFITRGEAINAAWVYGEQHGENFGGRRIITRFAHISSNGTYYEADYETGEFLKGPWGGEEPHDGQDHYIWVVGFGGYDVSFIGSIFVHYYYVDAFNSEIVADFDAM
ncbi:MAG: hypothetical protein JSV56_13095 [Methanomassiliicoccales archaeon]|nr:MAG: hypothetical protein JSV56_13095 [Methanomassiliicoccales archaeon]